MSETSVELAAPRPSYWSRLRACWRRIEPFLPYVLVLLYAIGLGLVLARHEMWRDETQAWLLVRDSVSPAALLHNMRYEGHPGLWHLLLWGVAHLTWNPVAMQVIHGLIAASAVFLVLRFAPFRWPTRILLCLGYFFSYEWAAISRNYSISVLLFFAFAILHRKRWRWFPAQAGVAFALCHTNIHSLILVLVLLPMLVMEFVVGYAGERLDARKKLCSACLGFLIVLAGLGSGLHQIIPPEDSGVAAGWRLNWSEVRAENTAACMVRAYAPILNDAPQFWNSNRILDQLDRGTYAVAAGVIVAAVSLLFLCQPWPVIPYLAGTSALLTFFYVKYPGAIRHHGLLFLLPIVLLWMSWDYKPWRLPWGWANWPSRIWQHLREVPLAALLLLHLFGAVIAIKNDWRYPFSMSKGTAEWIRAEVPEWRNMLLVGYVDSVCSPVIAHLEAPRFFYSERGEFGSYVIFDQRRRSSTSRYRRALDLAVHESEAGALLISPRRLNPEMLPSGAFLLHTVTGISTVENTYFIYCCPASSGGVEG